MARSLQRTWRPEHLFAGRHALDAFEFYGQQLAHCDQAIEADWQRLRITDVEPDMGKKRGPEAGGKARLGRITKRGDDHLRTRLIQGAKSAVMTAVKRSDRIGQWLVQLKERVGWQKVRGGAAQQERTHPVGGAHPRWRGRSESCSRSAGAALRVEPTAGHLKNSSPHAEAERR